VLDRLVFWAEAPFSGAKLVIFAVRGKNSWVPEVGGRGVSEKKYMRARKVRWDRQGTLKELARIAVKQGRAS